MDRHVKVYRDVDSSQSSTSFRIKRTDEIYRAVQGRPDEPHRHDYYTIVIARNAAGLHTIDFQEYELGPNQVYFISPGQVHQIAETKEPSGYAMTFTESFLVLNGIPKVFVSDINLFRQHGASPPLEVEENVMKHLIDLCQRIESVLGSDDKYSYEAAGAYLKLFLIECNNACDLPEESNTQTVQAGLSILHSFKELLENNYAQQHNVTFYAERLAVTADHLNKTVKALTGQTAKQFISSRIVLAAKRMLTFTESPAKTIGYELGFDEASHFSAFFKREVGESPTAFRKR